MIHQFVNRKTAILSLATVLLAYGIAGIGYTHNGLYPHFHDDSTTRSVAENVAENTRIGNPVSADDLGTYYKYVLGGTDAGSFKINEDNGQLKTKSALDYETETSYSVTVTIQSGSINPLSDSITGPIINYTDRDSISVTINVTDIDETSADLHRDILNGLGSAPQGAGHGGADANILDLVLIASQIGKSGETIADLNGDGIVNIRDLLVIDSGLQNIAAARSARTLTAVQVEEWLNLAKQEVSRPIQIQMSVSEHKLSYERGIQVLENILRMLKPRMTALLANYPNPFNPETWIPYQLATSSDVQITIYDAHGVVVRDLELGHQLEGYYTSRSRAAHWDGRNNFGEHVASGIYFYQLQADNTSTLRKMVILK